MTGSTWRRLAFCTACGILAAAMVPQTLARAKDPIPVPSKLSAEPPQGAIVLFGGKPAQMRENWYARRSTKPAGWTVDAQGVATPTDRRDIVSRQEFGDCRLHVEFRAPRETATAAWPATAATRSKSSTPTAASPRPTSAGPSTANGAAGDRLQACRPVAVL